LLISGLESEEGIGWEGFREEEADNGVVEDAVLPMPGRGSIDRRFPRLVDRLIAEDADTGPVSSASENDEVLLLGV
jgi:hypothetical protein